jgi:hypothetical protein
MFENFSDVLAGVVALVAVSYMAFAIEKKRKHLRELFNVIDADDAVMFDQLEEMVVAGVIKPHHHVVPATA